jgi:hypothetical protein
LVERRRPSALATRRFSVSPPLRLPKSSSLPFIDSSAPPTTGPPPQRHERHLNLSTTNPSVSPVPHPLFLSFSLWRRDVGTCVSAPVNASAPPRRSGSPFPVSPGHDLVVSSLHRFIGDTRNGTTSPTSRAPPHSQHHQPPPSRRLPLPSSCPSPSGEGTCGHTSRLR